MPLQLMEVIRCVNYVLCEFYRNNALIENNAGIDKYYPNTLCSGNCITS